VRLPAQLLVLDRALFQVLGINQLRVPDLVRAPVPDLVPLLAHHWVTYSELNWVNDSAFHSAKHSR
jgi:hypothetical protein